MNPSSIASASSSAGLSLSGPWSSGLGESETAGLSPLPLAVLAVVGVKLSPMLAIRGDVRLSFEIEVVRVLIDRKSVV